MTRSATLRRRSDGVAAPPTTRRVSLIRPNGASRLDAFLAPTKKTDGACSGPVRKTACDPRWLDALDDRPRPEAAATAHGHEADALVRPLQLVEQGRNQARACGAERVPERHRAAVHVH